jgi:hypothetical protein
LRPVVRGSAKLASRAMVPGPAIGIGHLAESSLEQPLAVFNRLPVLH